MFLGNLAEKEKAAFLCLAGNIIKADGVSSKSEVIILNNIIQELHIKGEKSNLSIEESCDVFAGSDEFTRRGIYIELLSLAMADNTYDSTEKDFLKTVSLRLDLSADFISKAEEWLLEYLNVLQKGIVLVSDKEI